MAAGNDVMRGFCLFCCCCFCPFLSTATTTEEATHNSNNNITFTTNINKGAAVVASLKLTSLLFYNLQKLPCLARLDFSFGLFFCAVIAFAFAACSRLRSLRPPLSLLFIKSYNVVLLARFQMIFNRDCFACCPPAVTDCLLKPSSRLFKYLYDCTHTHTEMCCVYANAGMGGGVNWEIMHYKDQRMTLTETEWSAGKASRAKLPAQAFDGYRISGKKLPLKYIIQCCFSFTVCEEVKIAGSVKENKISLGKRSRE